MVSADLATPKLGRNSERTIEGPSGSTSNFLGVDRPGCWRGNHTLVQPIGNSEGPHGSRQDPYWLRHGLRRPDWADNRDEEGMSLEGISFSEAGRIAGGRHHGPAHGMRAVKHP